MSAEVMVMCSACGRAQSVRPRCLHCGAVLPDAPVPARAPPPIAAVAASDEHVEVDLGGGRRMVIGPDALELQGSEAPNRFAFASMHSVRLEERPLWALVPAVLVLAFAVGFVRSWLLRAVLLVLLAASAWLFARLRRFVVHIEQRDGAPARVDLGAGHRPALENADARRAFIELADELKRRGIRVVR
ncbi:MAG TPA: hypothetical protein VE549_06630 [Myxococcaceae bacterium]|nr:hypothetical protein [Myxococcaceae bacterium]